MIIFGSREEEVVLSEPYECRLPSDPNQVAMCEKAYVEFHVLNDGSHEVQQVVFEDKDGNEVVVLDKGEHKLMMGEVEEEIQRLSEWLYEDWLEQGGLISLEREFSDGKSVDYNIQSVSDSLWRRRRNGSYN